MLKPSSACLLVLLVSLHRSLALPAPSSDFRKTILPQAAPGQPTGSSAELHGHLTSPPSGSGSGIGSRHFWNVVLIKPAQAAPGQPTGPSAELHGHLTSPQRQHSADSGLALPAPPSGSGSGIGSRHFRKILPRPEPGQPTSHPTEQEPRGPDHGQPGSPEPVQQPSRPRPVKKCQ